MNTIIPEEGNMEVTLRKASALSKALLTLAAAVKFETSFTVTTYDAGKVQSMIDAARSDFQAKLDRSNDLSAAAFSLRNAIGTANATAGINSLLTERAAHEDAVARMKALSEVERYRTSPATVNQPDAGRIEMYLAEEIARAQAKGERPVAFAVTIKDPTFNDAMATTIKRTQQRITEINDQLLGLNMSTKIAVEDAVADILKAEGLVG